MKILFILSSSIPTYTFNLSGTNQLITGSYLKGNCFFSYKDICFPPCNNFGLNRVVSFKNEIYCVNKEDVHLYDSILKLDVCPSFKPKEYLAKAIELYKSFLLDYGSTKGNFFKVLNEENQINVDACFYSHLTNIQNKFGNLITNFIKCEDLRYKHKKTTNMSINDESEWFIFEEFCQSVNNFLNSIEKLELIRRNLENYDQKIDKNILSKKYKIFIKENLRRVSKIRNPAVHHLYRWQPNFLYDENHSTIENCRERPYKYKDKKYYSRTIDFAYTVVKDLITFLEKYKFKENHPDVSVKERNKNFINSILQFFRIKY